MHIEPIHTRHFSLFQKPAEASELWMAGNAELLDLLADPQWVKVGVVGTRNPSARSLGFTQKLIGDLSGQKVIVISGFARGIDRMAHEAALKARLPTIGIVGSGLLRLYPQENLELKERILVAGGLFLSEYPPETTARPWHFPQRNRLIAALSDAVIVIEAAEKSGALSTAQYALEYEKKIYAVPTFPNEPGFRGNQRLIEEFGASPLFGPHSLGELSISLATLPQATKPNASTSFETFFLESVRKLHEERGGCLIQDLYEACRSNQMTHAQFYEALSKALENRTLEQHGQWIRP